MDEKMLFYKSFKEVDALEVSLNSFFVIKENG